MHVILIEPAFPRNQREFARGLHAAGARVTGIGERPPEYLDNELKGWLSDYHRISSVCNEHDLLELVRAIQDKSWVDRMECTVEAHIGPVARVREATSIPGISTRTAFLCRDKPAMKEVLRENDVPCAQSTGASSAEEVRAFAAEVGFPLILKPVDGAGSAGTFKVTNDEEMEAAIVQAGTARGVPTAVEEFIEGHEGFYDTLTIDGEVVYEFICHYYPGVLEAMRTRWISPQILHTNRNQSDDYEELRKMGKRVIDLFEIGTSATHMEWFFGPKGLKFSEIGCRPPGVCVWDIYSAANDVDLYHEWANAIVHGKVSKPLSHRFAGGMIALRPSADGKITGYEGVDQIKQRFADSIIDHNFPPPGSATQGVESGYMGNAWMRLRDPDFDKLRSTLNTIGETIKVHAR